MSISESKARIRIQELTKRINFYNKQYHTHDKSIITDSEYDISLNAFSYLIIDSGVTTGTVRCIDALTFVDNRTGSTATLDTSCTQ